MQYDKVPPRYNHSSTLVGHKMYIFGGKDEHGNTVSDLFMVNLMHATTYTPHLVLSGHAANTNNSMMLLKSQHFCEAVCGKLLVFGRYLDSPRLALQQQQQPTTTTLHPVDQANAAGYALWMLDLDTLVWQRQVCGSTHFSMGGWNYFTMITTTDKEEEMNYHHLLFLGNTDPFRPQGYDHFRYIVSLIICMQTTDTTTEMHGSLTLSSWACMTFFSFQHQNILDMPLDIFYNIPSYQIVWWFLQQAMKSLFTK